MRLTVANQGAVANRDVFNEDFIANWIDMKQKEYDALRLRPQPLRVRDV
jgi:glutamine synthetase